MKPGFATAKIDREEFHRRRAAARRRGTPAWLWPEVSVERWSGAAGDIARSLAAVLTDEQATLTSIDPMAMSLACYTSGVGPLLGWWLETGRLDAQPDIRALLTVHLEQSRAREKPVSARAQDVVAALRQRDIPVVVLKGGHTAYLYFPVPETRPASDLDLLVPAERRGEAAAAFADLGMMMLDRGSRESTWADADQRREPRSLWLLHADDPWSVDLHSSLDFSASAGASTVNLDRAAPFESAERWPLDPFAQVLPQPLLLLHLAVHASGGLHSLTMLRMVEIVLVVRKDLASGALSWDEFLELATRTGGLGAAYPALSMGEKLVRGTIPGEILERCATAAPARARAVVDRLEPSIAHRVDRASIGEHFMWVGGPSGWLRQLWSDVAADTRSLRRTWSIYEARLYRLLRGRLSR